MDIYNENRKTTYEFKDGTDEIFINFDENLFPDSKTLLIEFSDLDNNNDNVIYISNNNTTVSFYEMKGQYHSDFSIVLETEINIDNEQNKWDLNLRRAKIYSSRPRLFDKRYKLSYSFGFTKLQVESEAVKFNKENVSYLDYLCKKFEDAIEIIILESE